MQIDQEKMMIAGVRRMVFLHPLPKSYTITGYGQFS